MAMCTGQNSSDSTPQTRITVGQLCLIKLLKTVSVGVDERYRAERKLGDSWKFIPYLDSDMMVK